MKPTRLPALIAGAIVLAAPSLPATAQVGLAPPAADRLWPDLQARIVLQTSPMWSAQPVALVRPGEAAPLRGVRGGALFGDYVFARRSLGSFRATGGLVLGAWSGAPMTLPTSGARFGLDLLDSAAPGGEWSALPYVGLGYNSPAVWGALSVTADLGLVAGRPSGVGDVGRALLGNQALDAALRELRLAPLVKLGVRYEF